MIRYVRERSARSKAETAEKPKEVEPVIFNKKSTNMCALGRTYPKNFYNLQANVRHLEVEKLKRPECVPPGNKHGSLLHEYFALIEEKYNYTAKQALAILNMYNLDTDDAIKDAKDSKDKSDLMNRACEYYVRTYVLRRQRESGTVVDPSKATEADTVVDIDMTTALLIKKTMLCYMLEQKFDVEKEAVDLEAIYKIKEEQKLDEKVKELVKERTKGRDIISPKSAIPATIALSSDTVNQLGSRKIVEAKTAKEQEKERIKQHEANLLKLAIPVSITLSPDTVMKLRSRKYAGAKAPKEKVKEQEKERIKLPANVALSSDTVIKLDSRKLVEKEGAKVQMKDCIKKQEFLSKMTIPAAIALTSDKVFKLDSSKLAETKAANKKAKEQEEERVKPQKVILSKLVIPAGISLASGTANKLDSRKFQPANGAKKKRPMGKAINLKKTVPDQAENPQQKGPNKYNGIKLKID